MSILEQACERHGGEAALDRLNAPLHLKLNKLDGPLMRLKGLGVRFGVPSSVTLLTSQQHVTFHDFPSVGVDAVYAAGTVTMPGEAPTAQYRKKFVGLTKALPWIPADVVYFFGYALSAYFSFPFSLRDREVLESREGKHGSEVWIRFAEGEDTHSRIQGFFFDETGLLVRHDYRAEIMGAVFNGAHFIDGYRNIDGVLVGTDRRVRAKVWHYPVRTHIGLRVLHGVLSEAERA